MSENLSSLRRSARRLRRMTLAGLVLLALTTVGAAAIQFLGQPQIEAAVIQVDTAGLPPWQGALLLVTIGTLLGIALLRLARMLRRVEEGSPFGAGGELRGFAFYLFLSVLAAIVIPPLLKALSVAGTGRGTVTLALEGGQVLMLFVTGLLFLVARLLDEAQRVADDASQIV
ncbi:MAG: hypothetical protein ACXWUN_07850 [Allosphingosinicella sp.]